MKAKPLKVFNADSIALAQIAAPFRAAGLEERESLEKAYSLTVAAFVFQCQQDADKQALGASKPMNLDEAKAHFDLQDVMLRKWVIAVMGADAGKAVWGSALKGEKVFWPQLVEKIEAARTAGHKTKGSRKKKKGSGEKPT